MNYKEMKEIVEYDKHITEHNIEQFSAKLLFDLTRNTGFEVSKGNIGECWIKPCCERDNRKKDDVCGLDDRRAEKIIEIIDDARLIGKYKISSKFNGVILDIDKLSAGCKTVLNVLYYPNKAFCLKECGNNALELMYALERGYVYSEYALIPFAMKSVVVQTKASKKVISDYEELKEWWNYEE